MPRQLRFVERLKYIPPKPDVVPGVPYWLYSALCKEWGNSFQFDRSTHRYEVFNARKEVIAFWDHNFGKSNVQ